MVLEMELKRDYYGVFARDGTNVIRKSFDEVLPSIRKTGGYVENLQEIVAKATALATAEVLKQFIPMLGRREEEHSSETVLQSLHKRKKFPGIIERLPLEIRQDVDEMLCSGQYGYREIVEYLACYGVNLSMMAVYRYRKAIGL